MLSSTEAESLAPAALKSTLHRGVFNRFQHPRERWQPVEDDQPALPARFCALHEIFETQTDRRSDAPAVAWGDRTATYAELEGSANRIARHLLRLGIQRGSRVAMLLDRSVDTYAAILGTLKAGAAYVPIDPQYPPERIAYILQNSSANIALSLRGTEKAARSNGS